MSIAMIASNSCGTSIRSATRARTVYNASGIVQQWLKLNGITGLLHGRDKPSFVTNMREMYHRRILKRYSMPVTQKKESDICFFSSQESATKRFVTQRGPTSTSIESASESPQRSSLALNRRTRRSGRSLYLPLSSMPSASTRRARRVSTVMISSFRHRRDNPTKKLENKLKRIAGGAGSIADAVTSKYGNKCSEGPHCSKWFLHKFSAHFRDDVP